MQKPTRLNASVLLLYIYVYVKIKGSKAYLAIKYVRINSFYYISDYVTHLLNL